MTSQALDRPDQHIVTYGGNPGPYAIAHRGGAGLAPENTLDAFALAYGLGLRYLETDVQVTRDGVAVAFHDEHLGRVTGVDRPVASTDWATVRRLSVLGTESRVPRVDDLLDAFPDACFSVDVKTPESVEPLAAAIRRTGSAARVCVAGGWDRWLHEVRARVGPDLRWALGWRALATLSAAAELGVRPERLALGGFVHLPRSLGRLPVLRQKVVDLAHDLDQRVIAWTVDDPDVMHQLLDRGVDGIITDRPDVLREVLVARDAWVPPRAAAARR